MTLTGPTPGPGRGWALKVPPVLTLMEEEGFDGLSGEAFLVTLTGPTLGTGKGWALKVPPVLTSVCVEAFDGSGAEILKELDLVLADV